MNGVQLIFNNKKEINDLELLDMQQESKKPFIDFLLSTKWYIFILKIFVAYLLALLFIHFELFNESAIYFAYFAVEVILYNYLNDELAKP